MYDIILPNHLGIIMDGNGRWAKERGLKRSLGHKKGSENLKKLIEYIFKKDINILSIFAFSTDNFKREKEEVNYLMTLFVNLFEKDFESFSNDNIKIVFSGRRDNLEEKVLNAMDEITRKTSKKTNKILNICLNYRGQDEIVDTIKKISKKVETKEIKISDVNIDLIEENLYQKLAPLDFVIRTSGEQRLSNFMIWQASNAEFYFPKTYFPDFDEKHLDEALIEYNKRDRRFGGIKNEK